MAHIIGITGPSGSGKSLFSEYISKYSIPCINADEVYHKMLIPPSKCLDAIKNSFGQDIINDDGTLNRHALSSTVFENPEKLNLLNRTVLPIVIEKIKALIDSFEKQNIGVIAVDAPTLIESEFYRECDTVIVILAPASERAKRITERDHISAKHAETRIAAQKSDSFYKSYADFVLINDSDTETFKKCADEIIRKILSV